MLLSELLKPFSLLPYRDSEVTLVTEDSRKVVPGALFFAYRGFSTDGNLFVQEAVERGACCVITDSRETYLKFHRKLPTFKVKEPRKLLSLVSARFYGYPSRSLKLIGVTGTNGKTTTAFLIYRALNRLGVKAGYVGTLGWGIEELHPHDRTTPSPTDFFRYLKEFSLKGCSFAVCEVSSHALELDRLYGVDFELSIFTNLTPEHLDFHKDIYSYFLAKERLFFSSKKALFNLDDPFGLVLNAVRAVFPADCYTYGRSKSSDFVLGSFEGSVLSYFFKGNSYSLTSSLKGEFNGYNLLAAASTLHLLGFEPTGELFKGITVPGRLEEVSPGVFVDYAHTPDALQKLLKAVSSFTEGRVITVFGCGGDRDREKRPEMGRIAEALSDLVIITSDNPRNEEPNSIISEILSGIKEKSKVLVIPDRREAIWKALSLKESGDSVVIAGKGHEEYQIIGNKKLTFSDRLVVKEFYGRSGAG
jgi:UDP-N-acetylmuramoyl-L-alanyl-D-glutamate--2,6-diaminopimelate ligase